VDAAGPLGFDLQGLMVKVERAFPLDAVEVLAAEFARAWRADAVSFLIADMTVTTWCDWFTSKPTPGPARH
jgi:hypothetical protein